MTSFMWGLLIGVVGSPFAWEGLKFAYRKLKAVTDTNKVKNKVE